MVQLFKNSLKSLLPDAIWKYMKSFKQNFKSLIFKIQIKQAQFNHKRALTKVKKKNKIKVAFLLIHHADWKYEGVYRQMEQDARFDPVVFVCPYISFGNENMIHVMNEAYKSFINDRYKVIKTFNETTNAWFDIKNEYCPDLVCFTSPWDLTRPEYLISNFPDTLSCYVPYGYKISHLYEAHFNKPMQNLVWKFFLETEIHKKLSLKYSRNKSANTIVTGYPGMDRLLQKDYQPSDVWKIKDKKVKRIIWAPHHSLSGMGSLLNYSTFLKYADFMLEIANQFQSNIQIAFKPHPILRLLLCRDENWGKKRTVEYYQKWAEMNNGQLIEGDYMDLFFTSDAMIHDCGSFLIEYLYTNKPVMFLWNDDSIPQRFNEVGKMALTKLYRGNNENDIEKFINDIIINGNDSLKEERTQFFTTVITPPNQVTASENIFNDIKSTIFN